MHISSLNSFSVLFGNYPFNNIDSINNIDNEYPKTNNCSIDSIDITNFIECPADIQ